MSHIYPPFFQEWVVGKVWELGGYSYKIHKDKVKHEGDNSLPDTGVG